MPTTIFAAVSRLRQDLAAAISPDAIRDACRQAGHSWRNRALDPVATVMLFLDQVLHGNVACRHVVHLGDWAFTAAAYCKARQRLPLAVLRALVENVAAALRTATAADSKWLGRRVWVEDGSGFSMADVPALRNHFGQPSNQRPGCGFPVAKWVALFDLATGLLLRVAHAPLNTHDMSKVSEAEGGVAAGDVVLGDRGFCSYAHIAMLAARGIDAVFRLHQKVLTDFTPGRPAATKADRGKSKGLPRSEWVRALGPLDQVVIWFKPKSKPEWMTDDQFAALPSLLAVRELRYQVNIPGFRVRRVTLVTTLLDPAEFPASELAGLYRKRWQVELNFRHIKITMKMDVLRRHTVDGVLKELAMFALAYNLVRSAMWEASRARGAPADRVSFADALRWLTNPEPGNDVRRILINPSRPNRVEPRVKKRRPKQYPLMNEPRSVLRKRLTGKEVAA